MRIPYMHFLGGALVISSIIGSAADWPMRGRDNSRNAVSVETGAPVQWQLAARNRPAQNIFWSTEIGSFNLGDPVVADGLVWVGTNNDHPRDPKRTNDASVLMCFREADGKFLYQHVSDRLKDGNVFDWWNCGLASSPLVEGDRLWFCNNRGEVICLDIGALRSGKGEPREVWKVDLRKQLGVFLRVPMIANHAIHCSVASYRDLIYVNTTNARQIDGGDKVPAPNAPSLVCFQKHTGKVVWQDNSPGDRIFDLQHGSPLVIEVKGRTQVIMGQGDGWLRSFDALTGKLIWKFDINFKKDRHPKRWEGDWNYFMATPVFYGGRVYIGGGRHVEWGDGPGRLCCIDPTKSGDVSSELEDGPGRGKANPNSALVWEYLGEGEERMGRMLASVAIHDDLVIAPDRRGMIHCLDARTGAKQWTHDTRASVWCSPLIADGKVYVGDEDGDLVILRLARQKVRVAEHNLWSPIYASPVYANGVLYVMTSTHVHAIRADER
ncbi:MAG: PQQ-binding-like beta-propeller repeat protein [Verrucomicrobiota bacterium]